MVLRHSEQNAAILCVSSTSLLTFVERRLHTPGAPLRRRHSAQGQFHARRHVEGSRELGRAPVREGKAKVRLRRNSQQDAGSLRESMSRRRTHKGRATRTPSYRPQPMLGAARMSETMKRLRMKAPANPSPASLPLRFDVREQWPYCKDKMNEARAPGAPFPLPAHLDML